MDAGCRAKSVLRQAKVEEALYRERYGASLVVKIGRGDTFTCM